MLPPVGEQVMVDDGELRSLVLAWYQRARVAQLAHALAASRSRRLQLYLGAPAAVLSATVGASVLADVTGAWRVATGVLSLLAAVLIALQTFLRPDDRVREHEAASRSHGAIRRELGQLGAFRGGLRDEVDRRLNSIRASYDRASGSSPNVPDRIWARVHASAEAYKPTEFYPRRDS